MGSLVVFWISGRPPFSREWEVLCWKNQLHMQTMEKSRIIEVEESWAQSAGYQRQAV